MSGTPRELTPTEIDVEMAGILVGHELGGVHFTEQAEAAARAVLTGQLSADVAIAQALAQIDNQ